MNQINLLISSSAGKITLMIFNSFNSNMQLNRTPSIMQSTSQRRFDLLKK